MRNRWFSRYLYGIDNGVERDPRLHVVREGAARGTPPTSYAQYPNPGAVPVSLFPRAGGMAIGGLGATAIAGSPSERLTDDVRVSGSANAAMARASSRLLYATPPLRDSLHLSGTPRITVRLAASKPAANLSVWLVMLPFDSTRTGSDGRAGVITRGWADPQNHRVLVRGGNFNDMQPGEPLAPGTFYTLTFDLQPDDQIVPPGKRLALMLMSSDREFTVWPSPGTVLTFDLSATSLVLPVVGGISALQRAIGTP